MRIKLSNPLFAATYFQKYSTKKISHNSKFKKTFSVTDSLSRLFQAQVDWFSKYSLCKANSAMDKQNIVNLKSVNYYKI
jgi:hypothetical protein